MHVDMAYPVHCVSLVVNQVVFFPFNIIVSFFFVRVNVRPATELPYCWHCLAVGLVVFYCNRLLRPLNHRRNEFVVDKIICNYLSFV